MRGSKNEVLKMSAVLLAVDILKSINGIIPLNTVIS